MTLACRLTGSTHSFAALDIAVELEKHSGSNARMFHATFGAPPVGTRDFAEYFNKKIVPHESWSIAHSQDLVPVCFAWCGSKWYLRWLNRWGGWWMDWSTIGEKRLITKTDDQEIPISVAGRWESITDTATWGTFGLGALTCLGLSSLAAIPASAASYLWHQGYYKNIVNPQGNWTNPQAGNEMLIEHDVGTKYHSLEKYIELLKDDSNLELPEAIGEVPEVPCRHNEL
jgi:hypothetical protein